MVSRPIFIPLVLVCFVSVVSSFARERSTVEIVKSESDDNDYRAVTLSNGIQCVLVSDTLTETAAVVLRVDAGYLAEDTPGLAHFLEHMVFEGSVQYPDGNTYQTFVADKGGWFNAATLETSTKYELSIPNEHWVPAARMMSSFIGDPLLPADKLDSAIRAVDSEYKLSLIDDGRSLSALARKLANPENGYGIFATGSNETLNIPNIRQQALDFHKRYYSANLISLVIVANKTFDRLESLSEEIFGSIPNNNRAMFLNPALPFPTKDRRYLSKTIYFKKKEPGDYLTYLFPINMSNYPRTKYIEYLLDHEGKGSIYQYLLTRGYITSFGSYIEMNDPQFVPLLVYCELTKKGLADPDFITKTIFKYLKSACKDGVDVNLWKAINQVDELDFRFSSTKDSYTLADEILNRMEKSDNPGDYLGAPSQRVLDVEVENRMLSFLNPNNFNLYFGSDTFSSMASTEYGPQLTNTEYFYNTHYLDVAITGNQLESWETVEVDAELHLPEPNTFVPENFQIFEIEADAGEFPTEIKRGDKDNISIWWYQDQELREPKVEVGCRLYPLQSTRNPRTSALQEMLAMILHFVESFSLYAAGEAGFSSKFEFNQYWQVRFSGYSDPEKLEKVLKEALELFFDLKFNVDEEYFNETVRFPLQKYLDMSSSDPFYFAMNYINNVIYKDSVDPTHKKIIEQVSEISQSEVEAYKNEFLRDVSLTCHVFGNARKEQARTYANIIKHKLKEGGSRVANEDRLIRYEQKTSKLPKGSSHVMRLRAGGPAQINSAVVVLFQIDRDQSNGGNPFKPPYTIYVLTELLGLIMQHSCFNYLRTEKQLGYWAFCDTRVYEGISYFLYGVQGSRPDAGPEVINREINNHISQQRSFLHQLAQLPEGRQKLEQFKKALSDKISKKKRTVWEKAEELRNEVYSAGRDFGRTKKKLDAIAAVTVEDVVEFYESYIVGSKRRKLSSQIYGNNNAIPDFVEEGDILIENIGSFKETLTETFTENLKR